jgi:hypothetical protein
MHHSAAIHRSFSEKASMALLAILALFALAASVISLALAHPGMPW